MDEHLYQRTMNDGRIAAIVPLTFNRARIVAASATCWALRGYDDGW